jgi:hypothetical protein
LPSNSPAPALQEDKKAKNGITQQKEESNSNTLAKNSYVKCLGSFKLSYFRINFHFPSWFKQELIWKSYKYG